MRPDARREEILLEELGDELVIYDLQRHRVHQLNRTAALVWRCCDGHKTVAQLRKILQKEVSPVANDAIVYSALDRLGKAHLLRQAVTVPADAKGMTRRQAIRKFGRIAALALLVPAVTSIIAPNPVQAAPFGSPCTSFICKFSVCVDQCTTDAQCGTRGTCNVQSCQSSFCPGCTVRRCGVAPSPSQFGQIIF